TRTRFGVSASSGTRRPTRSWFRGVAMLSRRVGRERLSPGVTEPPQKLGPIPIESITAAAGKGYCSTAKDYKYGAPLRILEAKESASGHTTTKALASVTAARISAEIS